MTVQVLIFIFCLLGCGVHCWHLGNMQGIEACIDNLIDQGYLVVDEDEDETS